MNTDFEEYLRRQSIRPVPAEWREEILRAARLEPRPTGLLGRARLQPSLTAPPWWREWLWPCPRAWAGLAAAWGIILLLNVTAPDDPSAPARVASASWQDFAFLRQETEMIARLSDPEEYHSAPPPEPAALKPRSSREVKKTDGYEFVGLGSARAPACRGWRLANHYSPSCAITARATGEGAGCLHARARALPETSALSQFIC